MKLVTIPVVGLVDEPLPDDIKSVMLKPPYDISEYPLLAAAWIRDAVKKLTSSDGLLVGPGWDFNDSYHLLVAAAQLLALPVYVKSGRGPITQVAAAPNPAVMTAFSMAVNAARNRAADNDNKKEEKDGSAE